MWIYVANYTEAADWTIAEFGTVSGTDIKQGRYRPADLRLGFVIGPT